MHFLSHAEKYGLSHMKHPTRTPKQTGYKSIARTSSTPTHINRILGTLHERTLTFNGRSRVMGLWLWVHA